MPFENPGFTPFQGILDPMQYVPYAPGAGVNAPPTTMLVRPQNRPQPQAGPNPAMPPAPQGPNAPVSTSQAPPPASAGSTGTSASALAPLAAAAPQMNGGVETIFPAAQNAALQGYLRGTGGQTPGGMLPVGMGMPQTGGGGIMAAAGVPTGADGMPLSSNFATPNSFSNANLMAGIQQSNALRDTGLRQQLDAASIPGAAANQNARFAAGLFTSPAQLEAVARFGTNPAANPSGGLAGAQMRLDEQRVANEAWARTPAGRQAIAEQDALRAVAEGRMPLDQARRNLSDAARSGFFGGGQTPPPSALPGAPSTVSMPAAANAPYSTGPVSAADQFRSQFDDVLARIPERERSLGSFLTNLDRNMPAGFVSQNFPSVEAYLRQRFGQDQFNEAARGVADGPFGPVSRGREEGSGWGMAGRSVRGALSRLFGGGNDWTDDLTGRALLETALRSRAAR